MKIQSSPISPCYLASQPEAGGNTNEPTTEELGVEIDIREENEEWWQDFDNGIYLHPKDAGFVHKARHWAKIVARAGLTAVMGAIPVIGALGALTTSNPDMDIPRGVGEIGMVGSLANLAGSAMMAAPTCLGPATPVVILSLLGLSGVATGLGHAFDQAQTTTWHQYRSNEFAQPFKYDFD